GLRLVAFAASGNPAASNCAAELDSTSFSTSSALQPGLTSYTPGSTMPSRRRSFGAFSAPSANHEGTPISVRFTVSAALRSSLVDTHVLLPSILAHVARDNSV